MKKQLLRTGMLLATLLLLACNNETEKPAPDDGKIQAKVVYGSDNRLDLYQVSNPAWKEVAASTAALVRNSKLAPRPGNLMDLKISPFGSDYNLCEDEPFRDQGLAAFCSGFYVGGDYMITAGHCIRTQNDCDQTSFVFDFALKTPGPTPDKVSRSNVYSCRKVVKSLVSSVDGVDFAVVQLDRPVDGRKPLNYRQSGEITTGQELVVIGHPVGLPTKVAGDAFVRNVNGGFFVTNLDTYGGNSGSAVFNAQTGEVEGILVRGETDFKFRGNCRVSNTCTMDSCRGEDVTRIEHAVGFIGQ